MARNSYSNDWLRDLKDRLDIVDVVSRYVTLNQKGGNFWGKCPFHHEKEPSFAVNAARQSYHCFGCGESGDAIKFVEKMESISFMEAVKILADRVGFEIPSFSGENRDIEKLKQKKQRLLALMKETALFYHGALKFEGAKPAIEYMKRRNIPPPVQTAFGMGASPDFSSLVGYLKKKGFTEEEMVESGAVSKKGEKLYDSLGGRLIFPIIDSYNAVVAFGGRLLEKADFAKYKNTTQTMLFDKSNTLYGLNLVKKLKQREHILNLIIVEGYMDTISLYKAGFKNVVASMGTSLTEGQAKQIKRICDKVFISYDGDSAGQKATMRGLDILSGHGLEVMVVSLPDGLDPDDVINKYSAEGYKKLLDEALPLIDYKLKVIKSEFDLSKESEKTKYALKALTVIKGLPSGVEQERYLRLLKEQTGYSYETLKSDLALSPENSNLKAQNKLKDNSAATGQEKAVKFILRCLLGQKEFARGIEDLSEFTYNNVHRIVFDYAKKCLDENKPLSIHLLYDYVGSEGKDELDDILKPESVPPGAEEKKYFFDCIELFKLKSLERQLEIIQEDYEATIDRDKKRDIAKKMTSVMQGINELKKT